MYATCAILDRNSVYTITYDTLLKNEVKVLETGKVPKNDLVPKKPILKIGILKMLESSICQLFSSSSIKEMHEQTLQQKIHTMYKTNP